MEKKEEEEEREGRGRGGKRKENGEEQMEGTKARRGKEKKKGNTRRGEKSRLFVLVVPRGTRGSTSKAPFSAGLNPGVLINPAHLPVNALANNRRMNSSQ